ncbi:MAG: hypothetical protein WA414_01700 [Acidobacteriaceae bacterium]
MRRTWQILLGLMVMAVLGCASARADASLLLEEPFGEFGAMNPTGHAAIYLNHVCAETPTQLRPCRDGEAGVVLSRYHRIDGYDWLAIPLIPYLYAVDDPVEIPATATARLEMKLRDTYRRNHLMDLVPDDPVHEIPRGEWIELVGASYDRRIYGFTVATTAEQDDALMALFNDRRNISHFNLLFNNCANFSEKVLNFYYPHSIHRNFIADAGVMTPKQAAKSLVKYACRHPDVEMRTFVIPQVPGTIPRSKPVDGVVESLVKSKKYVVPLAALHPFVAGTLIAAYLGDGRFKPDPHAEVYNPAETMEPGEPVADQPVGELTPAEYQRP